MRFIAIPLACWLLLALLAADASAIVLFEEDFADNAAGWTLEGEWEIGPAMPGGGDPTTDHTPTGDNGIAGTLIGAEVGGTVHALEYLTSPAIDATVTANAIELQFFRILRIDYSAFMGVSVEAFDGSAWQTVWDNTGLGILDDGTWTQQVFDLTPYKNASLRVRFGFSANLFANPDSGWSLDDLRILSINTAPVLSPTVASVADVPEDAPTPAGAVGTPIDAIVGYVGQPGPENVTDLGPGLGIAVTSIGLNLMAYFSLDDGASWDPFPVVDPFNALLLPATPGARLFLQPLQAEWSGTVTNALIFRAWDQDAGLIGTQMNTTMNGGTSPFSSALGYADLEVTPVNDTPVLDLNGPNPGLDTGATYQEDQPPTTLLSPIAVLVDPDNTTMRQATVQVLNVFHPAAEILNASPAAGIAGTWNAASATYTFNGNATQASYLQSLLSLTFRIDSDNPDLTQREIELRIYDGTSWSAPAIVTVGILPVNDTPSAVPWGAMQGSLGGGFDGAVVRGQPVTNLGVTLQDADGDPLEIVSMQPQLPDGMQYLNWPTGPVSVPYDLQLTGTPAETLSPGIYTIAFIVSDGQSSIGIDIRIHTDEDDPPGNGSSTSCCGQQPGSTSAPAWLFLCCLAASLLTATRSRTR